MAAKYFIRQLHFLWVQSFILGEKYMYDFSVLMLLALVAWVPGVPYHGGNIPSAAQPVGDGPASSCFTVVSPDILNTGIEFLFCQLSPIFDTYVSTTPNLWEGQDSMSAYYQNMLFKPMQRLALLLLPMMFILLIFLHLLDTMLSLHKEIMIEKYVSFFISNAVMVILLPDIFTLCIQLNNAICVYILHMISAGNSTGSFISIINTNINIDEVTQNGFIPNIVKTILWGAYFISMLFIAIFFIVRFIVVWVIFLGAPLFICLGQLPYVKEARNGVFVKLAQFILTQPIFLLGIAFFIMLMHGDMDGIPKFIIGVCSLLTLSFIPSFIAGVTGSKLVNISSYQIKRMTEGIITRIGILTRNDEDRIILYPNTPLEKPDKK